MPTYVTPDGEEIVTKAPVMLRLGRQVKDLIDQRARKLGISRNAWITRAAELRIQGDDDLEDMITAEMLTEGREPLMVRFEPFTIELIDEQAEERGVRRTTWLIDACLAALARNSVDASEV